MADVSVVIPARNEEANIERVVRSVDAQENVLEIIVVDDGSEDATPRILERLKVEIPRLRVVRNNDLPEGWVGKNWALETGARLAQGDWLLFTDADTFHKPGSLGELLSRAEAAGAALLSVSPGQLTPTWWEKAAIPYVFLRLNQLYQFEDVSDPASPRAAANGQFLLIRRNVYEQIGSFEAMRGEILEDVALAKRVKQSGGRLIFLPGRKWIETRMYTRFSAMGQGWTKNLYLLYEGRLGRMLADIAEIVLLDLAPWVCFALPAVSTVLDPTRPKNKYILWVLVAVTVARGLSNGRRLRRIGYSSSLLPFYQPPGAALFVLFLLNSIRAYKFGGHVIWKGRSYSVQGARSVAR